MATDYVDLGSVTLPVFLDSFRKILDAIGMNGAKHQKLFILGGLTGYLSGRFKKDTRGMAEIQNDTEFDYSMDKLDNESLVILDSDITDILFPSQQGGVNTSDKNASGEKRNALDDTVFNQQLPAKSKVKFDDVDSEEADQILNDWEELRKDPIKEAMVGRLQDHYNQRLKSVTEDFEARMTQMETAMKKKTDEQRN